MEKKSKIILVSAFLLMGAVAGAVAFSYYYNIDSEHQVGKLWTVKDNSTGSWSEWAEMGDYDVTFDTSDMVGGDMEEFYFTINLSGQSNANRDILFDMTNDYEADGVTLTVFEVGADAVTDLEEIVWEPDSEKTFQFIVSLDEYTPEGTYTVGLDLTKN